MLGHTYYACVYPSLEGGALLLSASDRKTAPTFLEVRAFLRSDPELLIK